jgi:hypothetical protein
MVYYDQKVFVSATFLSKNIFSFRQQPDDRHAENLREFHR